MLYLGLDLGQLSDYSALAIVEEPIYCPPMGGWVSPSTLTPELLDVYPVAWRNWERQAPGKPPLWLRTLYRYELRTSYPDVVADIIRRLGTKSRDDAELVIDGTGVGVAVVDLFRFSALPCPMFPVVITAGHHQDGHNVPKKDLIDSVQVAFATGRVTVAHQDDITKIWLKEMQTYTRKVTEARNLTFNARGDSQHDDLVLAVALAVWRRMRVNLGE